MVDLSMLRDLVDEPADSGRVLAVVGEPGSGKTQLISALVRERKDNGRPATVLRSTRDADQPVIEVIRRHWRRIGNSAQGGAPARQSRWPNRDLIVVEDVHLADPATITELALIASGVTQPPTDVVVTMRRRQARSSWNRRSPWV
ncbi:hypothetical protein GCM10029964_052600 [Kibdelosporangium lantanae]